MAPPDQMAPPSQMPPPGVANGPMAPGMTNGPAGAMAPMSAMTPNGQPRGRARFEAANTTHDGRLTPDQAQAAGWRPVVVHFQEIDRDHKGYVTWQDIRDWQKARRAARAAGAGGPPPGAPPAPPPGNGQQY